MAFIQPVIAPDTLVLPWPALVTAQATVVKPVSWTLTDPQGNNASGLLAVVDDWTRSYTPAFLSGLWVLKGLDANGKVVYQHEARLGDDEGWMDPPDWDDASWSHRSDYGVISALPGGQQITLADVAFGDDPGPPPPRPAPGRTLPDHCDWINQAIQFPPTMTMIEIETRLTVSGTNHTGWFGGGLAADATGLGGICVGAGLEQTDAANQRGKYFKLNSPGYQGAANPDVITVRSSWPFGMWAGERRCPGCIHHYLKAGDEYSNVNMHVHGGFGSFGSPRWFGLWVGRETTDGSEYTVSAAMRLKVT